MTSTVVQYTTKAEHADENQDLIEAVFADLQERAPQGFSYRAFRLEDGVTFVHVVVEHDVDGGQESGSLQDVPAFQAFVAGVAERCAVPPVARGATVVGQYGPTKG